MTFAQVFAKKSSILFSFLLYFVFTLTSNAAKAVETPFDPFFWLEEVEGEHALEWVQQQNARTVSELESHPLYSQLHEDIKTLLFAKDRVPFSSFAQGYFWNFWQDSDHQHGVLRRTSLEQYKKNEPQWEVILDFDALSKAENENWVYKGGPRLDKNSQRGFIKLSRGGKDAVEVREFDYETRQFVTDGFYVPEAKTSLSPIDENTVLIGSDFGEGTLTSSGYPRTIKLWHRGQSLSDAKTVFEVQTSDLSAGALILRDEDKKYILFYRSIDFYHSKVFLQLEEGRLRELPLPASSTLLGIKGEFVYLKLKETFKTDHRTLPVNSILRIRIEERSLENAEIIFTAGPRQSIESVDIKKNQIFVSLLDQIRSKVLDIQLMDSGHWKVSTLPFPTTGIISLGLKDEDDPTDITLMNYTDHLTPSSQYLVHDEDGSYRLELLKSAPSRFDSSQFEVIQNFAISRDGTQVPYFLLKKKNLVLDGSHPTVLYGYGGFQIALTPQYSGSIGKLWLERGGVYVIANIRGGGEFGPEWHQAALKGNRQRSYDDFIAVAEDLISRKITSPAHLGIKGGSNGGLLVGATMVQRPDLFNAALAQVPLMDMARYSKLLAGASWIGEYGNPEEPDECALLLRYSPYHNVKPDKKYPSPMFTTSTKDDRVHPGHARKIAARMSEQGHSFYYYENRNGGHAGSANLAEMAHLIALEFTYLWSRLR